MALQRNILHCKALFRTALRISCSKREKLVKVITSADHHVQILCRCGLASSAAGINKSLPNMKHIEYFSTSHAPQLAENNNQSLEIVEKIQEQLQNTDVGRLFAVIHIDGNQRKVTTEDILLLRRHIQAEVGDCIVLNKVLLVGSKDFTLVGRPLLSPDIVRVEATVIEKTLSPTNIISFYKRRKDLKRFYLDKKPFTYLRINSIDLNNLKNS